MKTSEVEKWLKKKSQQIGINYQSIHETASGESNHNFMVEAGEKMVLRASKEISRESRLENEAEKLDFLEKQGIKCTPRKIFFRKETEIGEVLLETHVGQKDLDKEDLSEKKLRSLAEKIAEIHSIPVKNYEKFSGRKIERNRTLKDVFRRDFRKWSERPYREYLDLADEPDLRIKDFFQKQQELLDEIPETEVKQGLCHGDLGFNIRATRDKVFIIDWEFSRIDLPENEILYFFEHEDLDQSQREIFLNEYRSQRELDKKFDDLEDIYPKFLAFNDMIWAAKRVEEGDDKEKLFKERMEKLEEHHR